MIKGVCLHLAWNRRGIGGALLAALLVTATATAAEIQPAPAKAPLASSPVAPSEPAKPAEQGLPVKSVEIRPEEKKPEPVEPLSVRPLTAIEAGHNDANPVWSPSGEFIAFERSTAEKKEIIIAWADGTELQRIYFQLSAGKGEMQLFLPGIIDEVSYNAGLSWSPGGERYVFMSNGGEGNYDLYLGELGTKNTRRLTNHKEKDGHAHWSPVADQLVFVSGRTGKGGDIYLLTLANQELSRLTQGGKAHLFPQWSPDGKKIVLMRGGNENHDIYLIADPARPGETMKALTRWNYDDLRPVWSPDGSKIAFYSNYNSAGDPKIWSIVVIAADGSDPSDGEGLAAKVVATDVVPDVERGPAWLPDSARLVYVKNDKQEYNPLYLADLRDKTNLPLKTDTKMNHDVSCSAEGAIAFRAQVNQWDQIFVAKLKH